MSWIKKILFKEISKCQHGYPKKEDKIPHIKSRYRIENCKACSIESALREMNNVFVKIQITNKQWNRLKTLSELSENIKIIDS